MATVLANDTYSTFFNDGCRLAVSSKSLKDFIEYDKAERDSDKHSIIINNIS